RRRAPRPEPRPPLRPPCPDWTPAAIPRQCPWYAACRDERRATRPAPVPGAARAPLARHAGLLRVPLPSPLGGGRRAGREPRGLPRRRLRARELVALARAHDPLLDLLLPPRLVRGLARRGLVQRPRALRRHPADPRLHLHPRDRERAGREGRDGRLPAAPR